VELLPVKLMQPWAPANAYDLPLGAAGQAAETAGPGAGCRAGSWRCAGA